MGGTLQIFYFYRKKHYKPSMLGYSDIPVGRKPPHHVLVSGLGQVHGPPTLS